MAWLVLILALNGAISWWNARVCGQAWEESKAEWLLIQEEKP